MVFNKKKSDVLPKGFPGAGLYHYRGMHGIPDNRAHLRIDPDGVGTLIVNANQVLHLNPSGALIAYHHLEGLPAQQVIASVKKVFDTSHNEIETDYQEFVAQLELFLNPDLCPTCNIDNLEFNAPFSARPTAPYRMDLALTYRCNDDCAHCYNARPRDYPEIDTQEWKSILDNLWDLGIPHIVFTGGEPTLRNDLPELIAYAEGLGQITGLNSNARRLSDPGFVQAIVDAGLDHVQITVESHDEAIHDRMVRKNGAWKQTIAGLQNVLAANLYVMTNTTMLQENYQTIPQTIDFLADLGVPTIGLNALIYSGMGLTVGSGLNVSELPALLESAKEKTEQNNQRLIWYTPTQYCHFDPTQYGLGVKGCSAALYNMCIEPDGAVLPCQSYYQPLGYLLKDSWDSIWNHELSISIRERHYAPEICQSCSLLAECGAGCPLELAANSPVLIPVDAIPIGI